MGVTAVNIVLPIRFRFAGAACSLVGLCAGPLALAAQTSASGASPTAGTLEEIVVTAEKRSENLEKVPLSVVAFTAQAIAETGVEDFSPLAARIPGVTLNSAGPGQSSYSIRSVASVGGNAPTTGLYIDETPILPSGGDGATASIDPDLFDLARSVQRSDLTSIDTVASTARRRRSRDTISYAEF